MDELIIRSLMAETTAEEERQLMRWRAADPQHDARYRSLSATWELAGQAWTVPDREAPDADAIIARADRERWGAAHTLPGRRRGIPAWLRPAAGMLVAAAVTALLLAGVGVLSQESSTPPADAPYTVVAESGARTIHLSDGSTAHLEGGSRLDIDPAHPREVWLEGRAYFGISHQPGRPFLVRSSAGRTRVLGTRFDLTARGDELTVVVVEGRVEVISDGGEVEVGAGEESYVVDGAHPVVERADFNKVRAWLGNILIFQNTPLSSVANELETHFGRPVVIDDPALSGRTVTAVFDDRSLDEILPALCRAVDAVCVTDRDTVRFTR